MNYFTSDLKFTFHSFFYDMTKCIHVKYLFRNHSVLLLFWPIEWIHKDKDPEPLSFYVFICSKVALTAQINCVKVSDCCYISYILCRLSSFQRRVWFLLGSVFSKREEKLLSETPTRFSLLFIGQTIPKQATEMIEFPKCDCYILHTRIDLSHCIPWDAYN